VAKWQKKKMKITHQALETRERTAFPPITAKYKIDLLLHLLSAPAPHLSISQVVYARPEGVKKPDDGEGKRRRGSCCTKRHVFPLFTRQLCKAE